MVASTSPGNDSDPKYAKQMQVWCDALRKEEERRQESNSAKSKKELMSPWYLYDRLMMASLGWATR